MPFALARAMKSMSRATVPAGVSLFLVGAFLADMLVAEGPGGKEGGFRGHGGKRGLRGDRGVLYFAGGMGCVSGSRPRGACCPLQREFARGPLRVGGGGGSCRMAPGGDEFFDRFGFYEEDAQPLAPAESGPDTDNGVPFDPSKGAVIKPLHHHCPLTRIARLTSCSHSCRRL